ncbi:ParA family protein [Allorhizocola rhizosphaerae]|uniref:ParA family protein n=1 Tax=Allorhizocola rhizosphaerae TaxID=1872709 RepID=UPI000E3C4092|nr:ParA family protein [Allorhizocola rhizosphaerae]
MTLIAMVSAKGSPGVSTAALAFTLTWPAPTLLAECDPAGGDLLSGYLARYELPTDRGVLPLASAALRGTAEQDFLSQLIDLDSPKRERLVLPGITDPAQAASLQPAWAHLGDFLANLPQTVLVDCGRLSAPHPPWPVLVRADLVLLVLRAHSIRTISPGVPALSRLRREMKDSPAHLGLMLIGGGIAAREIARHLVTPVLARLAWDPSTAAALCGSGRGRRTGPLMRTAATAYGSLHASLAARRQAAQPIERRDTDTLPAVKAAAR